MQEDLFAHLNPSSRKFLFFDLETKYLAHEVGGWKNIDKLEVSCVVTFREDKQAYEHYKEEDLGKLWKAFDEADRIIGFNIHRFDLRVLSAYHPLSKNWQTLDMLEEIEKVLGHRLSLEHLAIHNLHAEKLGSGLEAVEWYREKAWEKLFAYCEKDVALTRDLYLLGEEQGYLLYQSRSGNIQRAPIHW